MTNRLERRRMAPRSRASAAASSRQLGFSMLELMIAVSLVAVVMTVVLTSFDAHSAVALVQQDISELQQSVRATQREIARNARMAGRGGVPRAMSILVDQNVPDGTTMGTSEPVLEGTDILTLRGTFDSPIYKIDAGDDSTFIKSGNTATLLIDDVTRSGFEQPLERLSSLLKPGGGVNPEAILLVSRQGESVYAVVELSGLTIAETQLATGITVNRATLTLTVEPTAGTHTASYLALSSGGVFPTALTSVLYAAVLEEYRYYIREDHAIPGDDTTPLSPKLARARMVPGTDVVHPDAGSGAIDIADGVFDLQLALGIDLDDDGQVDQLDDDGNLLAPENDEWLWNHADDDESLAWNASTLRLVRLTFLGQAGRPDRQYIAPAIASIENHDYSESIVPTTGAEIASRRYRRRTLQSVIDLRNL